MQLDLPQCVPHESADERLVDSILSRSTRVPDTAAVTDARLLSRHELVVELDYGQFYLSGTEVDPGLVQQALTQALDGEGVAQADGVVVVLSPHQNNLEMPLAVEVWDGAPDEDLDQWEQAFEAHLDVSDGGLIYGSPTMSSTAIDLPAGSYRALITGTGFAAEGWPGSTTPGDHWRIQLWPDAGPPGPSRVRPLASPQYQTPKPRFRNPGIAAVQRIHDALNRDQPTSGEGSVQVERRLPGNRHQLFDSFRDPSAWLTRTGRSTAEGFELHAKPSDDDRADEADLIVARDAVIECRVVEAKQPAFAVLSWVWLRAAPDTVPVATPAATTVRFDLETTQKWDGLPTTVVRVTHDQVPTEWTDDLAAYWDWMLERADYEFDLGNVRRTTNVKIPALK